MPYTVGNAEPKNDPKRIKKVAKEAKLEKMNGKGPPSKSIIATSAYKISESYAANKRHGRWPQHIPQ